jgi:hypothetical protein
MALSREVEYKFATSSLNAEHSSSHGDGVSITVQASQGELTVFLNDCISVVVLIDREATDRKIGG